MRILKAFYIPKTKVLQKDHKEMSNEFTAESGKMSVGAPYVIYRHQSGLQVIHFDVPGPVISISVVFPTESLNDAGLPHCMEHAVFLGSERHPIKGYLDTCAARFLANGTNAYTDQDVTVYEMRSVSSDGALALLALMADHCLAPALAPAALANELHHVDAAGRDAGVVYCEMSAAAYDENTSVDRALRRAQWPAGHPLSYSFGGEPESLRELDLSTVRTFHDQFYRIDGMTVIVVGQVPTTDLLSTVSTIAAQHPPPPTPYTRPILAHPACRAPAPAPTHASPVPHVHTETTFVPADATQTRGTVVLAWSTGAYATTSAVAADALVYNALELWTTPGRGIYASVVETGLGSSLEVNHCVSANSSVSVEVSGVARGAEEEVIAGVVRGMWKEINELDMGLLHAYFDAQTARWTRNYAVSPANSLCNAATTFVLNAATSPAELAGLPLLYTSPDDALVTSPDDYHDVNNIDRARSLNETAVKTIFTSLMQAPLTVSIGRPDPNLLATITADTDARAAARAAAAPAAAPAPAPAPGPIDISSEPLPPLAPFDGYGASVSWVPGSWPAAVVTHPSATLTQVAFTVALDDLSPRAIALMYLLPLLLKEGPKSLPGWDTPRAVADTLHAARITVNADIGAIPAIGHQHIAIKFSVLNNDAEGLPSVVVAVLKHTLATSPKLMEDIENLIDEVRDQSDDANMLSIHMLYGKAVSPFHHRMRPHVLDALIRLRRELRSQTPGPFTAALVELVNAVSNPLKTTVVTTGPPAAAATYAAVAAALAAPALPPRTMRDVLGTVRADYWRRCPEGLQAGHRAVAVPDEASTFYALANAPRHYHDLLEAAPAAVSAKLSVSTTLLERMEGPLWAGIRGNGLAYSYDLQLTAYSAMLTVSSCLNPSAAYTAAGAIVAAVAQTFTEDDLDLARRVSMFTLLSQHASLSASMNYQSKIIFAGLDPNHDFMLSRELARVTVEDVRTILADFVLPIWDPKCAAVALGLPAEATPLFCGNQIRLETAAEVVAAVAEDLLDQPSDSEEYSESDD